MANMPNSNTFVISDRVFLGKMVNSYLFLHLYDVEGVGLRASVKCSCSPLFDEQIRYVVPETPAHGLTTISQDHRYAPTYE